MMRNDSDNHRKPDLLLKRDNQNIPIVPAYEKIMEHKKKMGKICGAFIVPTRKYNPKQSISFIKQYLDNPDKISRMLYSEISSQIFSLDVEKRGSFLTNTEKLLQFSLDKENRVDEDCQKIIIKIHDHSQLAFHQAENAKNIFADGIKDTKAGLMKEIKSVEKEYIAILGIFASIVFALVGSLTFSASVLENISDVGIYRLLLVIDFLAFIFLNIIYLLIRFIFFINEKENKLSSVIKNLNITCIVVAAIVILAWLLDIQSLAQFISQYLPWGR